MIRLNRLAPLLRAKILARFGRSAIIVSTSGLIFGIALAGLNMTNGALNSAKLFSDSAYNGHQMVQAVSIEDEESMVTNESIIREAKAIYDANVLEMKQEARKLGVPFDDTMVVSPLKQIPGAGFGEQMLDLNAPSALQAIESYKTMHGKTGIDDLQLIAKQYGAVSIKPINGLSPMDGSVSLMPNNQEVYSIFSNPVNTSYDFISQTPLRLVDEAAVLPFIDKTVKVESGEMPVTVPYSAAETILGLKALGKNASRAEILDRLTYLSKYAKGAQFSVCYRNNASKQQIDQAINGVGGVSEAIDGITYRLPANPSCKQAEVVSDARTSEQRAQDAREQVFYQLFGSERAPIQRVLSFKVIGVTPDTAWTSDSTNNRIISITQSILGPSLLGQTTITTQAFDKLAPDTKSLFALGSVDSVGRNDAYLVEFTDVEDARTFMLEQSCEQAQFSVCDSQGRYFSLKAFGSSGVSSAEMRQFIARASQYVVAALSILAAIIMAGMFGKIIADERQEIAVFRISGATKLDIVVLYTLYAFILSIFAILFAILIALIAVCIAQVLLANDLTIAMQLTYGVLDPTISISLLTPDVINSTIIFLIIIGTGVASALVPLLYNINKDRTLEDIKG